MLAQKSLSSKKKLRLLRRKAFSARNLRRTVLELAKTFPKFCPSCGEARISKADDKRVDHCLQCGFLWDQIKKPEVAYSEHLVTLPDAALLDIFKAINKAASGLCTEVVEKSKMSKALVSFVMSGQRRSAEIDKILAESVRERLQAIKDKDKGQDQVSTEVCIGVGNAEAEA